MRNRILVIHSGKETFVEMDRDLLNISFEVQDFYAERKFPAGFLNYLRAVKKNGIVFCWFASWNSFWALLFAKIMLKNSVLVIGGYDLANLPEANYGHQRGGVMKWVSRFAMNLATTLITNSNYSKKEAQQNAGVLPEKVRVIYHGVPDRFGEIPAIPRDRMALTVGNVDWPNLKRKGLEPFVRAAAYLPDLQFVLVGEWKDKSIEYLRSIASENIIFTGRVSEEELDAWYKQASVYVQASLHEGFGLSVAEAMLAGCIPVTTKAGALPEVVGECGFYCDSTDPSEIAKSIEFAINSSQSFREKGRIRILNNFSMEKRKEELVKIILSISTHEQHAHAK
jgi:glycosyltransferase involved in cell wall biosynthesis